jgi:thiamine phosphate synthase YjbQ (UPF0047 family)
MVLQQIACRETFPQVCRPLLTLRFSALPQNGKGMHLVTSQVVRECEEGLKGVDIGIFTLHCLHTSAGLTVSATRPGAAPW